MLSQTPTEKLCAELASRSAFIVKQREAGIDTTRLESTQASKLCAKIGSTRLDCDAGILVTEAVSEGCWSESHAQSLHVAATNAVADASDDDTVSGSRVQQTCEFPERICVTSTDLSELNDHQGDEEFACLRVGNRAWLGGITCPKEFVKAHLGAIAMVLGGLPHRRECQGEEAHRRARSRRRQASRCQEHTSVQTFANVTRPRDRFRRGTCAVRLWGRRDGDDQRHHH